MVMMYSVTLLPYGENEKGDFISDFDEDEVELIYDLFQSLGRKCVKEYDIIEEVNVERENDLIVINYAIKKDENITEDDFLFYLESLTGHNSDNIISFGDDDYSIKGSPVLKSRKKEPDEDDDFMEKMMSMARDIAPELVDGDHPSLK